MYHYKTMPGNGYFMLTKVVTEAVPLGVSLAQDCRMRYCMIIIGESRK
jgi:hypothetical protein